jgi:hypothetical protein
MNDLMDEVWTGWWLENKWDDTVHAGENMRRFRAWFFGQETGEDDE